MPRTAASRPPSHIGTAQSGAQADSALSSSQARAPRSHHRSPNGIGRISQIVDTTIIQRPQWQNKKHGTVEHRLTTTTAFTYDALGRINSQRQQLQDNRSTISAHTVHWQYAPGGQPAHITLPSGAHIGYHYTQGQLERITLNGQPFASKLRYNALGRLQSWTLHMPDGTQRTTTRNFDSDGRMSSSGLYHYTYDAAGRITSIDGAQTATLQYDKRDRLTAFNTTSYRYDANSNRLLSHHTQTLAPDANAATTVLPELHTSTNTTSNTNTAPPPANPAALRYDPQGQLVAFTHRQDARQDNSTASTLYIHNTLGQRIFKSNPLSWNRQHAVQQQEHGSKLNNFVNWWRNIFGMPLRATPVSGTSFVYDTQGYLLGEYTSTSTIAREYVWLPDADSQIAIALLDGASARSTGRIYSIHPDHLGTPRQVHNAQGQMVWQWPYSGFGQKPAHTAEAGFVLNLRYAGQYFDAESGLHENWWRTYNPHTGRYISADPIGLNGGWNRFVYVEGNPMWAVDPTGELGTVGAMTGAGIELGIQAFKNHIRGCDILNWGNYNWYNVAFSAAIGAISPGWITVFRNSTYSARAISTLSGQLTRARTANRAAKVASRIRRHTVSVATEVETQLGYQGILYILKQASDAGGANHCECSK